jgi:hypothetical protein
LGIAPKFEAVVSPEAEQKKESERPGPLAGGRIAAGVQKSAPRPEGKRERKGNRTADSYQLGLFD